MIAPTCRLQPHAMLGCPAQLALVCNKSGLAIIFGYCQSISGVCGHLFLPNGLRSRPVSLMWYFLTSNMCYWRSLGTMAFVAGIVFYRLSRGSSQIIFRKSYSFQPNDGLLRKVKKPLRLCLVINLVTADLLIYGIGPHRLLDPMTDVSAALAVKNETLVVGRTTGTNIIKIQLLVFIVLIMAFL